jgi:serine/threonine-protein kinase RsbW
MSRSVYQLEAAADAAGLSAIRHGVADALRQEGYDDALIDDIRLAVTEACGNVVRHAYAGEAGPLRLDVESDGERVVVRVLDDGVGYSLEPDGVSPALADVAGRGLLIIRALTSHLEMSRRPGGGTRMVMVFEEA